MSGANFCLFLFWCLSKKSVILSFSEQGLNDCKNVLKAKACRYLVLWKCSVSDLGPSHRPASEQEGPSHNPAEFTLKSSWKQNEPFPLLSPTLFSFKITQVPIQHCFQKYFKTVLSPLVLACFYTNSDFLLCRAGKTVLCFPKGAMTPVRKNK